MQGLRLDRLIRDLDEQSAVAFAHALLTAERGRLGLPVGSVEWGLRVKVADGGVDGRTTFPTDASSPYPLGKRLWQVKSGPTTPDAKKEFAPPRRRAEKWLVEQLKTGEWGYVLLWTHDPVDPERARLQAAFDVQIDAISPTIERAYITLDQIVDLCRHHPQTALPLLGVPTSGALSVDEWRASFEGDFVGDADRLETIRRVREFGLGSDSAQTILRIYGDSGAGKSRVAYEAVKVDGLRERTLVSVGPINAALPSWVRADLESSLVLVLDDATAQDVRIVRPIAAAAGGRLRVIAIEHRTVGDVGDDANIEIAPLEPSKTQELMRPLVAEGVAFESVANLAGGYPALAMELARALRDPAVGEELATLARRREIGQILGRMIPDDEARLRLAAIAPFTRLGVEGDAGEDFLIVCEELGLDPLATATTLDRFTPRFVARSGRYRRVTPGLLGIWLFEQAVSHYGTKLIEVANRISAMGATSLFERMAQATGSTEIRRFGGQLVNEPRFAGDHLSTLPLEGARLLSVLGVIDPERAADRIGALIGAATADELRDNTAVRRDLVWALEEILWCEPAFERAMKALFTLAVNETETWSNNASGVFTQVYQLFLSGTPVAYDRRLAILRSLLVDANLSGRRLIVSALGKAFDFHYSRTESHRGRVTGHPDWSPTREEAHAARVDAWSLLADLARAHPDVRDEAGGEISRSIRGAIAAGLGSLVDDAMRAGSWDAHTRANIVHELRLALDFSQIPATDKERVEALVDHLAGEDFADRLETAFAGQPHEVGRFRATGEELHPDTVDLVVDDLVADPSLVRVAVAASTRGVPLTAQMLFQRYGRRVSDSTAYAAIESELPAARYAAVGFISGRDASGDGGWVDGCLNDWSKSSMRPFIPMAVRYVATSEARAVLAIEAVETGAAPPIDLSILMYGAWAQTLPEPVVTRMARALLGQDAHVTENALGILEQWLSVEGHATSDEMRAVGLALVDETIASGRDSTGITSLLRSRVLRHLGLQPSEIGDRLVALMITTGHLDEFDLEVLDAYLTADPEGAPPTLITLLVDAVVADEAPIWVFHIDESRILSRVAAKADVDKVASTIETQAGDKLARILDHVAVRGPEHGLDPLFARLLGPRASEGDFRGAAASQFVHEERGWWGPYWKQLEKRRDEAMLLSDGHPDDRIRRWATWVTGLLEARIDEARRRDEEDADVL